MPIDTTHERAPAHPERDREDGARRRLPFAGRLTSLTMAPGAVVRIAPLLHAVDAAPPVPPAGTVVALDTVAGTIAAEIVESRDDRLLFAVEGARWMATPLRPDEATALDEPSRWSGARDWVVRVQR